MHTIAVVNRKGGVGKTTTAVNVAAVLAERGRRVLLVDLDTQRNASTHVGLKHEPPLPSPVYRVLVDGELIDELAQSTGFGFDLLASGRDLDEVANQMRRALTGDGHLAMLEALRRVEGRWDMVLLDTPPNVGDVTTAALIAADYALIPTIMQTLPYEGLLEVLDLIDELIKGPNPELRVLGIFSTLTNDQTTLADIIRGKIDERCPGDLLEARIRINTALGQASERGMPVLHHDSTCHGSEDYRALVTELATRGVV